MQATYSTIDKILSPKVQYKIPLFQRQYTWARENWKRLWEDIENCDKEELSHFFGTFVCAKQNQKSGSVPETLVIDGQQRLTTIMIVLIALRDKAGTLVTYDEDLARDIQRKLVNTLASKDNQHHSTDYYKFLPSQIDKTYFCNLIDKSKNTKTDTEDTSTTIRRCYLFFQQKLKFIDSKEQLRKIYDVIISNLQIVMIDLDETDNYYVVYESLNSTGVALTQADLIRNLFFMKFRDPKDQEDYHKKYWIPMESKLGDKLTQYLGDFLMQEKYEVIRDNEIFLTYKKLVGVNDEGQQVLNYLEKLNKFLPYYEKILEPNKEIDNMSIRKSLQKANKLENSNAYPFYLKCYNAYLEGHLTTDEFSEVLSVVENFIIRRYICISNLSDYGIIFTKVVMKNLGNNKHEAFVRIVKEQLASRKYPSDEDFETYLVKRNVYSTRTKENKIRLILEAIEEFLSGQSFDSDKKPTIEHVLPQTLSSSWQSDLGQNWKSDYDAVIHTIGNLTLTYYNSELGNQTFSEKKDIIAKYDKFELNQYFLNFDQWGADEIRERSQYLASIALKIWASFANKDSELVINSSVTGKTPKYLIFDEEKISVKSWREVLTETFKIVDKLYPEKMKSMCRTNHKWVTTKPDEFRISSKVGAFYIYTGHAAEATMDVCKQLMNMIEKETLWSIEFEE